MMRDSLFILLLVVLCGGAAIPAAAQSSDDYSITDAVINAGGTPADGLILHSADFVVTLSSIGDAAAGPLLTGESFQLEPGLITANAPVANETSLRFLDRNTLSWTPTPPAVAYSIYKGNTLNLPSLDYGACFRNRLPVELGTTFVDPDLPPRGQAITYLVTGSNRLAEEGSLGTSSAGARREASLSCP